MVRHQQATTAASTRLKPGSLPDTGHQLAELLPRRLEGVWWVDLGLSSVSRVAALEGEDEEVICRDVDIVRTLKDPREVLKVARLLP